MDFRFKFKKLRIPLSSNLTPSKDLSFLKKNKDKIINYIFENIEFSNILIYCYDGLLVAPLIVFNRKGKYLKTI